MSLTFELEHMLRTRAEYEATFPAAWSEMAEEHPAIADAISQLYPDKDRAMSWACVTRLADGLTPVELVAAGRDREVMDRLNRIAHGLF